MKGASKDESCINLLILSGIPPTVTANRSYIPKAITEKVTIFDVNDTTISPPTGHYVFYLPEQIAPS